MVDKHPKFIPNNKTEIVLIQGSFFGKFKNLKNLGI